MVAAIVQWSNGSRHVQPLPASPEGEERDVDVSEALPFRGGLGGAAIASPRNHLNSISSDVSES
jgi:hypothetical protein